MCRLTGAEPRVMGVHPGDQAILDLGQQVRILHQVWTRDQCGAVVCA